MCSICSLTWWGGASEVTYGPEAVCGSIYGLGASGPLGFRAVE